MQNKKEQIKQKKKWNFRDISFWNPQECNKKQLRFHPGNIEACVCLSCCWLKVEIISECIDELPRLAYSPPPPRETEGPRQEGLGEERHRGESRQSAAQEKCQDKVTAAWMDQHTLDQNQNDIIFAGVIHSSLKHSIDKIT